MSTARARRPRLATVHHVIRELAAAVALSSLALSACSVSFNDRSSSTPTTTPSSSAGSSSGADRPQTATGLDWGSCDDPVTSMADLQCATLDVPTDPKRPDGATTTLALVRKQSTGRRDERIGSLLLNPGGPGGSGLEFLANTALAFPTELTDRFDLVSFDPRGVGRSDPVLCLDDAAKDEQIAGDLTPDTPEEQATATARETALRDGCVNNNPDLIAHMSTADVAADLDRIRAAVGDDRLNYLGFSYGTAIGAVYASLFPDRVRAMVLDGSVSPGATPEEEALVQATGFERALQRFVDACNANPKCPLAPDAAGAIAATRAELATQPVEVTTPKGSRRLGPDQFDFGLGTALYDTSLWQSTAQAVKDIRTGGAARILSLVDRQTGRQNDGTYDNSSDAQVMVNCSDASERYDAATAAAAEARITAAAPVYGPLLGSGLDGCSTWPAPANPLPKIGAPDAAPILVVGTVGDPATPYEWAQAMTAALGSATLLTYEGDGHTAFLTAGPCISDAVVSYLVDLTVPEAGTRCPAESGTAPFADLSETAIKELVAGGVPRELATCIIDGIVADVGADEFERILLDNDQEQLTKLAAAKALSCAAKPR